MISLFREIGNGTEFVHFQRSVTRPEFVRIEFVEIGGNRSDMLATPESARAIAAHWRCRRGFSPVTTEVF
jgi:hypothetical protein